MAKFMKTATVVEATQMLDAVDMGGAGNFQATDWFVMDAAGAIYKFTDVDFKEKYKAVSQDTPLQGEDVS